MKSGVYILVKFGGTPFDVVAPKSHLAYLLFFGNVNRYLRLLNLT